MLGSFKKIFNQKEKTRNLDPNTNPKFLIIPNKIGALLANIKENSLLCTITFDGVDEEFNSSILAVQLKNQKIILDELFPLHGNNLVKEKDALKLSTIYDGVGLSFKLSNLKTGRSREINFYKADIPGRIYYPQRRTYPRLQIPKMKIAFSGIVSGLNEYISGYVFDVSKEGISVTSLNNRNKIQRGDLIKDCKIILDKNTIEFDIIIRLVRDADLGIGRTQIGGCFKKISSRNQSRLEKFIANLERKKVTETSS